MLIGKKPKLKQIFVTAVYFLSIFIIEFNLLIKLDLMLNSNIKAIITKKWPSQVSRSSDSDV